MKSKILAAFVIMLSVTLALPVNSSPEQIEVGALIERVIGGEEFSGKEIVVSGIALTQTSSGNDLLNIGTNATKIVVERTVCAR